MTKHIAIGIDIGGQHIKSAAIDIDKNSLITDSIAEQKVNNQASAEEILSQWVETISRTLEKFDINTVAGFGFAMPGPFDYVNGIALFTKEVAKFENLYNINVSGEMRKRLQLPDDFKVRYINDATAFGVAEAWIGTAKDDDRVIALTLGTGFGSCFIENGIPVVTDERVPETGCLWYLPLNGGIADDSFSTRWFIYKYNQKTGKIIDGAKMLSQEAKQGDPHALQLFEEYGSKMGNFISHWLKSFDAQSLVLGGNIVRSFDLFGNHLTDALVENKLTTKVYLSELMDNAAIIGSARLIDDGFYSKVKNLL
jgi:glucokinase